MIFVPFGVNIPEQWLRHGLLSNRDAAFVLNNIAFLCRT